MYITLSKYFYDKCVDFAEKQLETSKDLYSRRGEYRLRKIKEDIITGKLGEVAAYEYLKKRGLKCCKPDFNIYEKQRKSFDADLTTECGKKVHVKSQSHDSMVRYGASWLMQKSDKLTYNPTENDLILMIVIRGMEADILGVVNAKDLINNELIDAPKIGRYAHTKCAIYFNDIKKSGISLEAI